MKIEIVNHNSRLKKDCLRSILPPGGYYSWFIRFVLGFVIALLNIFLKKQIGAYT